MDFPILKQTSLWAGLSQFGKEIISPQGIFYWAGRAQKEAEVNATIGTALEDDGTNCFIPMVSKMLNEAFFKKITGRVFDYAPMPGLPTLREKWRKRMLRSHMHLDKYTSIPVVTNGITQGIYTAGLLFLNHGETLLTPEKYWSNYNLILPTMQQVTIKPIPFFTPQSGDLDFDGMRKAIIQCAETQGKVVLLLNFPHNQTGFTPNAHQANELVAMLHDVINELSHVPFIILLDDAYEGYVYDHEGLKESIFDRLFMKGQKNFSMVKMDGASKTMLVYGLRMGFFTIFTNRTDGAEFSQTDHKLFCDEVTSKVAGVIRGTISNCPRLSQAIIEQVLDTPEDWEKEVQVKIELLAARFRRMQKEIDDCYRTYGTSRARIDPFNSGFFCFINLAFDIDPKVLTEKLLKEYKIGVVPNTVKDQSGNILWNGIRVAFCGVPENQIKRLIHGIFEGIYSSGGINAAATEDKS